MTRKKDIPPTRFYPSGFSSAKRQTLYKLIDVARQLYRKKWKLLVLRDKNVTPPTTQELREKIYVAASVICECENGHRINKRVDRIMSSTSRGGRCLICYRKDLRGRFKYCVEDLKLHAISQGGVYLGGDYVGAKEKYPWECASGHRWEAAWKDIHNKRTWCPRCAYIRMGESRRGASPKPKNNV